VNTTGAAPSDSSLKIAEIDTGADTATELNRNPSAEFEAATIHERFTVPTYATLSDVPDDLPAGSQVFVESENQLYVENGE